MKKLFLFILAFFPLIASSYISDGLFNGFWYKGLQYADIGDGTCFVGFHGAMSETEWEKYSGDVVIPESADGKRVIAIGIFAFLDCTEMTSITIPETIIEIGPSSFLDCRGLTSINIPGSVKTIGKWAFEGCSGLASIELQDGLSEIHQEAFRNCSSLTSVTIPGSVTSIGEDVFAGCDNLKTVNIIISDLSVLANRKIESAFDSSIEMHYIYKGEEITDLVIPEGVTSINSYVFAGCSSMTSVTIPSSVKTIDQDAFLGCSSLTSIELQEGVTTIKDRVFKNCRSLTSITIPSSVNYIGKDAFEGCSHLKFVNIDVAAWCNIEFKNYRANPTYLTKKLFLNGEEIIDLVIPEGVTSIGEEAFHYCSGITSISIPNSVVNIATSAFSGCSGLTSITIPNSVTSIGDHAFFYIPRLTSLIIPKNVNSIGIRAFSRCMGLSSITVESGNQYYDSRDNCNAIIETSSNKLIAGCKNTIIPNNVTTIGMGAFENCNYLTSITIPNSVITIEQGAFFGCPRLKSITIPNSVTTIGVESFYNCGLTSVFIGSSVNTIDKIAFASCKNLTTIGSFNSVPPSCKSEAFRDVDKEKCIVWVPKGCVDAYKKATGWEDFQNIREVIDGDYDLDGKVDGEDVSTLATNISNASADANIGDINGDNEVNVADVVALINKMNGQALLGETAFYLIGDHNGWNTTDKTYAFTKLADGKTWEITIPSEGAGCFKVAPGSAYNHQDVSFWSYLLCAEYDQYTGLHGIMQQGDIMAAWLLNTEGATSYTIRIVPSEMTYKIIPN